MITKERLKELQEDIHGFDYQNFNPSKWLVNDAKMLIEIAQKALEAEKQSSKTPVNKNSAAYQAALQNSQKYSLNQFLDPIDWHNKNLQDLNELENRINNFGQPVLPEVETDESLTAKYLNGLFDFETLKKKLSALRGL